MIEDPLAEIHEAAVAEFCGIAAGIGRVKALIARINPDDGDAAADLLKWMVIRLAAVRDALGGPV